MNFLIVAPRLIENEKDMCYFPLGIAYISSALKKQGFSIYTLNLNYAKGKVNEIIIDQIKKYNIDVVMTGGLSVQYRIVLDIIRAAKQIDVLTIVGGGMITADPTIAMEALQFADIGIIGEGEVTICELANALQNKSNLHEIDGLIFKHNNCYITTNPRKEIKDLDSISWPDHEGFEIEKNMTTGSSLNGHKYKMAFVASARSCPYNCTFCFHTSGNIFRKRSLDNFTKEVDHLISKYSIECLFIVDELFSKDYERLKSFCEYFKFYNLKWTASFRVDTITPEIIPILKESGCVQMGFGVDSADNRILKSMRKHITIEQTEKALKLVYEAGLNPQANMLFGDPAETVETSNNSYNWAETHKEYSLKLAPIIAYPGSFVYKQACSQGIIKDKIKFLRDGCPQKNLTKMTDNEYGNLILKIYDSQKTELRPINYHTYFVHGVAGRIDLVGECICGEKNDWKNIKIFNTDRIYCKKCQQKLQIPFDPNILKIIKRNIIAIINKYSKIVLWGMPPYAVDIIKKLDILTNENIFLVDISESAQCITIEEKKIFAPSIINTHKIKAVVVLPSDYYTNIKVLISTEYPNVKKVFNMANLIERIKL